ncbi:MAG: hypothetical protein HYX94_00785 [Chloroflexi bacterium]|nr:hypothetical protein [Chloroflexota bacterium]
MSQRDRAIERGMERLLDDERLRSQLTDRVAELVLSWAEARVAEAADRAATASNPQDRQSQFEDSLRRIRSVMRRINDLTGAKDGMNDEETRAELAELAKSAGKSPDWEEIDRLGAERRSMCPEDFGMRLVKLVSGEPEGSATDPDR